MQAKHTPGPWRTTERPRIPGAILDATGAHVAQCHDRGPQHRDSQGWLSSPEADANARLIAAAPDLAAALDALVALAYDIDYADDDPMLHDDKVRATLAAAEAALVKSGVRS